jgi:hypothetical protein
MIYTGLSAAYVGLQDTVGYPGMGQNHSHSIVKIETNHMILLSNLPIWAQNTGRDHVKILRFWFCREIWPKIFLVVSASIGMQSESPPLETKSIAAMRPVKTTVTSLTGPESREVSGTEADQAASAYASARGHLSLPRQPAARRPQRCRR